MCFQAAHVLGGKTVSVSSKSSEPKDIHAPESTHSICEWVVYWVILEVGERQWCRHPTFQSNKTPTKRSLLKIIFFYIILIDSNLNKYIYIDIFCIIHAIQMLKSVLKSVRDSKKCSMIRIFSMVAVEPLPHLSSSRGSKQKTHWFRWRVVMCLQGGHALKNPCSTKSFHTWNTKKTKKCHIQSPNRIHDIWYIYIPIGPFCCPWKYTPFMWVNPPIPLTFWSIHTSIWESKSWCHFHG